MENKKTKNRECTYCGKIHDPKEVKRMFGKESAVYHHGYCSAFCFTKNAVVNQ